MVLACCSYNKCMLHAQCGICNIHFYAVLGLSNGAYGTIYVKPINNVSGMQNNVS